MLEDISRKLASILEDTDAANIRVVFAIFCKVHVNVLKDPLCSLAQRWPELASGQLGWQFVGGNATRLSRSKTDTLQRIQREINEANGEEILSFLWQGPDAFAPEYRFRFLSRGFVHNESQPWSSVAELVLPLPSDGKWEPLVNFATEVCAGFPYDSAYVSPAFVCGDESLKAEAGRAIAPLAMRHHGIDVANNTTTAYFIGRHTRGARWLSFLSHEMAEGIDSNTISDEVDITVDRFEGGIRIRASTDPEIGDTNRLTGTPNLSKIATALKPVTFFGDHNLSKLLGGDKALVSEWENRFF